MAKNESHKSSQRSFVSFDGTPIGYQLLGNENGVPVLVANGLGAREKTWSHVVDHFGEKFRFILWDYRGLYTSGRPLSGSGGLEIEAQAKDAVALLEHLGVDHFFGLGWSMGVQVLLEMHRHLSPDRFRAMVLYNGVAGKPYDSLLHSERLGSITPKLLRMLQRFDGVVTRAVDVVVGQKLLIPFLIRAGFLHHDVDRGQFSSMVTSWRELDMSLYLETLRALGEHDARDQLPRVRCATLLISGTHDAMTPMKAAEQIVANIRDARMEIIPGGTHHASLEQPEMFNGLIEEFLMERFPQVMGHAQQAKEAQSAQAEA